jgi:hypothetical protein
MGGKVPQGKRGSRGKQRLNKCVWGVSPVEKGVHYLVPGHKCSRGGKSKNGNRLQTRKGEGKNQGS